MKGGRRTHNRTKLGGGNEQICTRHQKNDRTDEDKDRVILTFVTRKFFI